MFRFKIQSWNAIHQQASEKEAIATFRLDFVRVEPHEELLFLVRPWSKHDLWGRVGKVPDSKLCRYLNEEAIRS